MHIPCCLSITITLCLNLLPLPIVFWAFNSRSLLVTWAMYKRPPLVWWHGFYVYGDRCIKDMVQIGNGSSSNDNKSKVFFARYKLKCGALILKVCFNVDSHFNFEFSILASIVAVCFLHWISLFLVLKGGIWEWHNMQWSGKDELGRNNASCKCFHFYYFLTCWALKKKLLLLAKCDCVCQMHVNLVLLW